MITVCFVRVFHLYLLNFYQETMENVKKCKNFLSTLIKLASSGKQSTETAANVKELVQNLRVRVHTPAPALERSTWLCQPARRPLP